MADEFVFPENATVIITTGGQTVSLSFEDGDGALDWFEFMDERFKEFPPLQAVQLVLTGGPFSRHTIQRGSAQ